MFKKAFHLSEEGSRMIWEAGIWNTVFHLASFLPVILLAMIAEQMMEGSFSGSRTPIPLWGYVGVSLGILVLMFVTYKISYHKEYLSSGEEDLRLRMELADKIRKLPLSHLEKRNVSDLTSVIMDDVTTIAHVLSQTATELIGGLLTGITAIILLAVYDWRITLSLAACLPIAGVVMALCRPSPRDETEKTGRKSWKSATACRSIWRTLRC